MKTKSKSKRLYLLIAAALLLCMAIVGIVITENSRQDPQNIENTEENAMYYAKMSIENYGDIILELDASTAPITVENFVTLVNEHFYDGLTFHRIISGFMIQGGDPNGNGTGGSKTNIKGEFSANGVKNDLMHTRGVISMARSSMPDSASSQFFIMHQDAPHLDGQYAAFGKVLSGMEVVDAICENVPVTDNNGTVMKENQPVISSLRMITAEEAGITE